MIQWVLFPITYFLWIIMVFIIWLFLYSILALAILFLFLKKMNNFQICYGKNPTFTKYFSGYNNITSFFHWHRRMISKPFFILRENSFYIYPLPTTYTLKKICIFEKWKRRVFKFTTVFFQQYFLLLVESCSSLFSIIYLPIKFFFRISFFN